MDILRSGYSGSIPANYDRYLRPFLFERFAEDLVRRLQLRRDMRVLELACGTGVVTERLRSALPPGSELVASDLQSAMLDCARARLGTDGITWREADAGALPFGDSSFDAAVCQFGWMFFPDKTQCAREARRVLAPGGQLLFNVWGSLTRNEFAGLMQHALDSAFGPTAPVFLKTPYGYGDPAAIGKWLADAGFDRISVEEVILESTSPSVEDLASGVLLGTPLFNELGSDPARMTTAREAVVRELTKRYGSGKLVANLTAYVAEAKAP